jgi:hypothetical protein
MKKFIKKGLICAPDNPLIPEWGKTRLMLPTPLLWNEHTIRIFLGFCDAQNVGRVGYIDVSADNPSQILAISKNPVFDIGKEGCFDDNGVVPTCVFWWNNQLLLYYAGFQLGVKVPYYMFQGLAISQDENLNFQRFSEVPILDRIDKQIYSRVAAFVNPIDNQHFELFYIGGGEWREHPISKKPLPVYQCFKLKSDNFFDWKSQPSSSLLPFLEENEHGFSRAWFWKEANGDFSLYYAVRTLPNGYTLGWATSPDGENWERKDADLDGLALSGEGWDSQMACYPALIKVKERIFLFYNGNENGKSGLGWAELAF